MSFLRKIMPLIVFFPTIGMADVAATCGSVSNYKQFLECAESKSPDVQKAELALKEKAALTEVASQFQNPELSVQAVSGSLGSEKRSETDVSLAFPIELGGKRSARKQIAGAEKSRAQLELFQARSEARKTVSVKLMRLRQIEGELDLIDESLQAFTKLVKQYDTRPALSPEQEVTLTVFKVAKSEYGLRRMEYDEELSGLESYFRVSLGLTLADVKKALPPKVKKWPALRQDVDSLRNSPLVALYEADLQVARGGLSKAQGDAWPTMNVGPSAKISSEGGREFQQWGINLSLPIPVLNANGAAKAAAAVSVQAAEQKKELIIKKLESERDFLKQAYQKSVAVLESNPNGHALESKHKKIENFFFRGLVPSSLVIEAHRSMLDFEKTRNERELKAIEAYLDIQLIDGNEVELDI